MKLNILFLINRRKVNSKGLCALMCRLTYNKVRNHFTVGLSINPTNWHSKQQLVKPPEPDSEIINSHLSLIRTKLNQAFLNNSFSIFLSIFILYFF